MGSLQIPTQFDSVLRLAEIGGLATKHAREIYEQVEAATLGGWRAAAKQAEVPAAMIAYWEKEMIQQTQALRTNAKVAVKPARRK
jgi:serine/threonine-protein kinase HipA